jgi:hypothetical protein
MGHVILNGILGLDGPGLSESTRYRPVDKPISVFLPFLLPIRE